MMVRLVSNIKLAVLLLTAFICFPQGVSAESHQHLRRAQDAFDADDRQLHAYTIAKKRLSSRIWGKVRDAHL